MVSEGSTAVTVAAIFASGSDHRQSGADIQGASNLADLL
jgi:hypothetical protein